MKSRAINSVRNTSYAIISQITVSLLMFITRTIFVKVLSSMYLGLSGLFGDILTLLSLAELGVGTAITYSMYKPVAENDKEKISALLKMYGKVYNIIGIVVTVIGISLTPFLSFFISELPDLSEIKIIYMLYLLNTSLSYFFIYKKSMLIATQNMHIVSIIQIIIAIIQNILQIIVIIVFKNFILYLCIQIICTLANNLYISYYVNKKYPYLKQYKNIKVDYYTKMEIKKNVAAMFLSKVSSAIVTSTDNILISKFVSTIMLGYYSNYLLFVNLIRQVIGKIFEAITGSVGNLLAIESKEKSYETFKIIWFANFWIIGLVSITLFILIDPFIGIWIGKGFILNKAIVLMICINLYMRFIRNTQLTYIDTYGLFQNIKWKCILEATINLIVSLIYLKVFNLGIAGVLLGTFTSNLLTNFWYEPYIIYNKKFKLSTYLYFKDFFKYTIATIVAGVISYFICEINRLSNTFIGICINFSIILITVNLIYILIFYNTKEFNYFYNLIFKVLKRIKKNDK